MDSLCEVDGFAQEGERGVSIGLEFERSGTVIGVVVALPGTQCVDSILLDQVDGNCEFYDLSAVTIRTVL